MLKKVKSVPLIVWVLPRLLPSAKLVEMGLLVFDKPINHQTHTGENTTYTVELKSNLRIQFGYDPGKKIMIWVKIIYFYSTLI